jgi:hypothetical protein
MNLNRAGNQYPVVPGFLHLFSANTRGEYSRIGWPFGGGICSAANPGVTGSLVKKSMIFLNTHQEYSPIVAFMRIRFEEV